MCYDQYESRSFEGARNKLEELNLTLKRSVETTSPLEP